MLAPESPETEAFSAGTVTDLTSAPSGWLVREFALADVTRLRHAVRDHVKATGLTGDALDGFVVAVHELVTNAVRHGGGRGRLELRRDGDTLICDVADHGAGFPDGVPITAGPPAPDMAGGRGVLLARRLTDTLLFSDGPDGVTATVTACLPASSTPPDTHNVRASKGTSSP